MNNAQRAELEGALAEHTLDGADWNTMYNLAYNALTDRFSQMTEPEFTKALQDFAPHLLEEDDEEGDNDES